MEYLLQALNLLFGSDPELRQIIGVTLQMSVLSTSISALLGLPLGIWIGSNEFRGKQWVQRINNTLMGLPPVVAGLAVMLILSRSGPLGQWKLLYTVTAMVIAQVVLITPILTGLTANLVSLRAPQIRETAAGMGLSPFKRMLYTAYDCRVQFVSTILAGFGRAIAEVGAVQIVGGNVQYKTRVMTTAIMLQTNMGHFEF
ncbi:MAG: tungstate transport system permease protein, partial [Chloroflexota bacterium]|nr:tungstate transport system permease protein [Chloroflexota bacterium]